MTGYDQIPDPEHPRLPIALLIDTSESMRLGGKIDLVNEGLTKLIEIIQCDELADKRIELAIISFGDKVEIIREFSRIRDNPELPCLVTKGFSQVGDSILRAIKYVEDRKEIYKKDEIDYYRPVFILIAGSLPIDMQIGDDKWYEVIKAVHYGVANRKFRFFTLAVEKNISAQTNRVLEESAILGWEKIKREENNVDLFGILKLIAPPNKPPIKLENFEFRELFFFGFNSDRQIADEPETAICVHPNHLNLQTDTSLPDSWSNLISADRNKETAYFFYRIIGASAIGPLHLINSTPCQDAYAYEILPSGIGIIAVADGLGSARLSDLGARNAVDTAVRSVKELICGTTPGLQNLEDVAKRAAYSARKALEEKAIELQCKLQDLACTLIVIVILKDGAAVAHIGDGAVIAKTGKGLEIISAPGDSEYANEVSPITGKDWEDSLRISCKDAGISAIMAFTDGLQRVAFKKTSEGLIPSEGFCSPLFLFADESEDIKETEEDLKNFLLSEKFKYFEDDKTLVIFVLQNNIKAQG